VADPLYSVTGGQGDIIKNYGKCLLEKWEGDYDVNCMIVASNVETVLIGTSLASQSDQEEFLMKLHQLRSNDDTVNSFLSFISSKIPDVDSCSCRHFFQVWVRQFSTAIISCLAKLNSAATSQSPDQPDVLTTVEQNVLYYISGYMVKKLEAATVRQPKLYYLYLALLPRISANSDENYRHYNFKKISRNIKFPENSQPYIR